jgi:hypothetical protein
VKEVIERYRDLLVARMSVLEEEVRLAEARYKEGHGDFHYVTLENVAVFERQVKAIHSVRAQFQAMDIELFETIEEFKDFALARLQQLYGSRVILRSGVRMLIECVRDL